jgi:hypothetical protein
MKIFLRFLEEKVLIEISSKYFLLKIFPRVSEEFSEDLPKN